MKIGLGISVMFAAVLAASSALAATVQYNIAENNGTATVTGTITTDGTLGAISGANIVSFDLTVQNGSNTSALNSGNARLLENSVTFQASGTQLAFDFSQSGNYFLFYENNNVGFWCIEGANGGCSGRPSASNISVNVLGSRVYAAGTTRSGAHVLGTVAPIPLPAGLPLFLGALGALAIARRRRF